MATMHQLGFLMLLLFGFTLSKTKAASQCNKTDISIDRNSFPKGFIFGTASAAYQYEGAAFEYGRGPSVWDTYSHEHPERIADRSNGDIAIDHYHRYPKDVKIMENLGFDAYRFSISWSRVLPNGTLSGGINKEGIQFYNDLIDDVLSSGLKPFVTLFHWDVPQALEDEFGGFLSSRIVEHFTDFVDLCYWKFGDRVKHWITLNEPNTFTTSGYALGSMAPGRCSAWQNLDCLGGDSSVEPYLIAHHLILSHLAAARLYKDKYQACQNGSIGITVVTFWFEPASNKTEDIKAAFRAIDFMFGWFMDPVTKGDYPASMREYVGKRLPRFTKEESKLLKGSCDFLGLNYYTGRYASNIPQEICSEQPSSYVTDSCVNATTALDGKLIGPPTGTDWLFVYPVGLYKFLLYTQTKYNNPLIYITENGVGDLNIPGQSLKTALNDTDRVDYYRAHLCYVQEAIKENGTRVEGYFAWSMFDNYEWNNGYSVRFGIVYIDYINGLRRHPKLSAKWFKHFLQKLPKGAAEIRQFVAGNVLGSKSMYEI